MLNENQKALFKRIENHYNDTILGIQQDALRIIVMGTAGTGKMFLINSIRNRICVMATQKGYKSPMIVIAPTGVAAFNVNGVTIHATLSIPITNNKN